MFGGDDMGRKLGDCLNETFPHPQDRVSHLPNRNPELMTDQNPTSQQLDIMVYALNPRTKG